MPEDAIVVIGRSVYSYILTSFRNLSEDKESSHLFRRKYRASIQVGTDSYEIDFVINEVDEVIYLDIIVEGKNKAQMIKCLEQVQEMLLSSGIRDNYIDIISYDSISEYYCNKILPKLNALERNLRKLLLNIYTVNFGKKYYQTTISPELQNKIKGVIQAKGSEDKKEIERLQKFFYSFELNDVQKLLFAESWTDVDEQAKKDFLSKHNDLSQLSDEGLRNAFSKFTPKSDWERFFSDKIDIPDIENVIERIRQHRNAIAHFKFFYNKAYTESNSLISKLNAAVLKAIKITEDKDFAEKNAEYISEIFERMKKEPSEIMDQLTLSISHSIQTLASSAMEQLKETLEAIDSYRFMQELLDQQKKIENMMQELPKYTGKDIIENDAARCGIDASTPDEDGKEEDT